MASHQIELTSSEHHTNNLKKTRTISEPKQPKIQVK